MGAPRERALDPRRLAAGVLVVVALGMAAGIAVVLLTNRQALLAAVTRVPLWSLAAAVALTVASWLGQGLSFAALAPRRVRGQLVSMTAAFLGGDFPALVTPFGSGGIPGGVFSLTREGLTAGEAGAVIAMHSLLTSVFFAIAGVVAAIVLPMRIAGSGAAVWSGFVAAMVVLGLIAWLAVRPQHAVGLIERLVSGGAAARVISREAAARFVAAADRESGLFADGVRRLTRERPANLVASFAGLAFSRSCLAGALLVVLYGLGWRGDVVAAAAIGVAAMVLTIASPTPGGSGAVEAVLTALLATMTAAPIAGAAALLWRVVTFYLEVLVGWALFSRYLARPTRRVQEDAS
jgi:uncharacterized protein (TIRG00374 family)